MALPIKLHQKRYGHNQILKRMNLNIARVLDCFDVVVGASLKDWAGTEPKFTDVWKLAEIGTNGIRHRAQS